MIEDIHDLKTSHNPIYRRRSMGCSPIVLDTESTIPTSSSSSKGWEMRSNVQRDDEKLQKFFESLHILADLAKMDSEKWQQTLFRNGSSSDKACAATLQMRFDNLQSQWKLEETPMPQIFESIHQFHSKCLLLTAHLDHISEENQILREELAAAKNHICRLETTVKKLHRKKETLKQEKESWKAEKQILMKGVHTYARDLREAQTSLEEAQTSLENKHLERHESIMKQVEDTLPGKSGSSSTTDSDSASLSSVEDGLDYVEGSSSFSTGSTPFITNTGVATLQIEEGEAVLDAPDSGYLTLHYPANSKVGLQFHQIKQSSVSKKANRFRLKKKGKEEELLCVCGNYGFDYSLNSIAPQIGAQLAAVNGEKLDATNISLVKIREALSQGTPYTLSFKEETLSIEQIEILTKAAKLAQKNFNYRESNE